MKKLKQYIESHWYGTMTAVAGVIYAASIIASVWAFGNYIRMSKTVQEIYRIQREVHPGNL